MHPNIQCLLKGGVLQLPSSPYPLPMDVVATQHSA